MRLRELLLWYWALSLPGRRQVVRPAYLQPLAGALLALIGLPVGLLGFLPLSAGLILSLSGLVLVSISYPISRVYHSEYPGRFNPRLEEYVARRVSRLSEDQFIPQFTVRDHSDKEKIRTLNRQVRRALRVELLRLKLSERTMPMPVCGVLVVGPKQSNKTDSLWHAMAHELKGWTFVQWPHHMDHPANLARSIGHRVVLWVDDLHDFAHPGEAAALTQFVQQLRDQGQQTIVLSTCRDGQDLQETEHYFRPLMRQLQRVVTKETLSLVQQLEDMRKEYEKLPGSQKSVLDAMDWLKSVRVLTFPYEVLEVLNPNFPHLGGNPDGQPGWEDTISALSQQQARFVRSEQRADAQTRLDEGSYNFIDWLRYNLFSNLPRPDKVVVPVRIHYLDLESLRSKSARGITATLEQNPETVIQALAAHAAATETLILLGDAYLNHLGEDLDNAGELAIRCYQAALQRLDTDTAGPRCPGAWAAALIGKGTAELREGQAQLADADFKQVTESTMPKTPGIPATLLARAWHGRGDAIHALAVQATGDEMTKYLETAAECYEHAAQTLSRSDPLWGETTLDRANVLYELAEAAARRNEQQLASRPAPQLAGAASQPPPDASLQRTHPLAEIADAQRAYQEAQAAYPQLVAPAVWAEIQRRQGDLCLMEARCFLPASTQLPQPAAGNPDVVVNPAADPTKALELAKKARSYFVAARSVFAPAYLPVSWSRTQLGLARALLIIAPAAESQAWDLYALCLETTKAASAMVSTLAQAPFDWVELQLLGAEAEIGRAPLDEGGARPHYTEAVSILNETDRALTAFLQIPGNTGWERMKSQANRVKSLRRRLDDIRSAS